jgi:hypothetical protein
MKIKELLFHIETTKQRLHHAVYIRDHELELRLMKVLIELHNSLADLVRESIKNYRPKHGSNNKSQTKEKANEARKRTA